ncbi:putative CEN-like protein 1-like [Capsicum annuum]|uniref:Uncharacterized protein n=1 Tax=Capsicum annuum TaxID=4072 RepID=A0A1U8G6V2_CAPAN|nr:putative CEN-like protein 1-like [Capsicum annuum]KAF3653415.1 putative CEN-like protein 1-like [Capsicum annuum]PHT86375.1 hypothetical protein T459_08481 [Capsicum annuum]
MIKLDGKDTGDIKYMRPSMKSASTSYDDSVRLMIKGQDLDLAKITIIMIVIDLSRNYFEGVIPKSLKDISSLWLLINLSHNNLRGDFLVELEKLNTLEVIYLLWNQLTGKIPQELTRLTFMTILNLSHNLLVGQIPQGPQFNTLKNDSYCGNLDLRSPPLPNQCGTRDPSLISQPLESEEEE